LLFLKKEIKLTTHKKTLLTLGILTDQNQSNGESYCQALRHNINICSSLAHHFTAELKLLFELKSKYLFNTLKIVLMLKIIEKIAASYLKNTAPIHSSRLVILG
jgi:hypothetical protein